MFVVFEGIDGSGKTTLSNRVADRIPGCLHVRRSGAFASKVTDAIRELGRDQKNLELAPRAELLLYLAREVQLYEEVVAPARARSELVIADRYLYSAQVLAEDGRGMSGEEVRPLIAGTLRARPDLVILVDVDPHMARARKRVARIRKPEARVSSRKGLTGVGLQHRLRTGYLKLAAAEPERWLVVDNTDASLSWVAEFVTEVVQKASTGHIPDVLAEARGRLPAKRPMSDVSAPEDAQRVFLEWIDARMSTEPDLAAYFLSGLYGAGVDERRRALAERSPSVTAFSLGGLNDDTSWWLRERLVDEAPGWIARSLTDAAGDDPRAGPYRVRLSERAPEEVALSLEGRDDSASWNLRRALYARAKLQVLASLKRLGSEAAWSLRAEYLREQQAVRSYASAGALAESVAGLDDEDAWQLRAKALERAPARALESLAGLTSERAWSWRERYLLRATRPVMRSLDGLDSAPAWRLRERAASTCKEALDSMIGLDAPAAWQIRESCADLWPSTVVKSLGALATTEQGRALVRSVLARHGGNVSLLKHAAAIALGVMGRR